MAILLRRLLSVRALLLLVTLFAVVGCKVKHSDHVTYRAKGFTVYDGLLPVIDGELVERNVYDGDGGYLKASSTSLVLTNSSGFAIELDLQLTTAYWQRRIDFTYLSDGEVIDLGVVSYDANALDAALSTVLYDLDYYWFDVDLAF